MPQSKSSQAAMVLVFLGLMAAAVYFFIRNTRGPIAAMPNDPGLAQAYICTKCGHLISLTPRQLAEQMTHLTADQIQRVERTSVRRLILPCPACHEMATIPAAECPRCGKPYLRETEDGMYHVACPDCERARQAEARKAQAPGG